MTRFACPSTSSSMQSVAGPSKINKRTKPGQDAQPDVSHKRGQSSQRRAAKVKEAIEAKKKDEKQKLVRQQIRPRIFAHVYIGNLEASVTEQRLQDHFASCGSIKRTTLRVSRGQAITVGVAPKTTRTTRDRKYATMEFYSAKSALDALKLHGSMLEGVKLVVSAAAGDLPEVADIARPHIQNIRLKGQLAAQPTSWLRALKAPKPLVRSDTETDFSDPQNDRIRIWGISFDKCII